MPTNGERLEASDFSDLFQIQDIEGLQNELSNKAGLFHGHQIIDVVGLETELASKAVALHSHGIDDVTNLQAALDLKADVLALLAKPQNFFDLFDVAISEPLNHVGEFLSIDAFGQIVSAAGGEASSLSTGQTIEVKKLILRSFYPNDVIIWTDPGNHPFTCPAVLDFPVTVRFVGGGGGGAAGGPGLQLITGTGGGGGEAGQVVELTEVQLIPGAEYSITVGAGGAGGVAAVSPPPGSPGEASGIAGIGQANGGAGGLVSGGAVPTGADGAPAPYVTFGGGGRGGDGGAAPGNLSYVVGTSGEAGDGGVVVIEWSL